MADNVVVCVKSDMAVQIPEVENILSSYPREPRFLLPVLLDIQKAFRFLPVPAMKRTAEYLCVPQTRVFSVATFYKAFSLSPRGEKTIRICAGTACHLRGSASVLKQVEKELGISPGETTEDGRFTLETVNCLGACALAPVIMVEDRVYGKMTPQQVADVLQEESDNDR